MQRNVDASPRLGINGGHPVLNMNTIDHGFEKANSPLMRVGSTITTQISSPG